eukprot:gene5947-7406_t
MVENLSIVEGDTTIKLKEITFSQLLRESVTKFQDKIAIIVENKNEVTKTTFKEFQNLVDSVSAAFIEIGIKKGDFIGVWSPECLETLVCLFALPKIGAVTVNLFPTFDSIEFQDAMLRANCKGLIIFNGKDEHGLISNDKHGENNNRPYLNYNTIKKMGEELLKNGFQLTDYESLVSCYDPSQIIFSSGSTERFNLKENDVFGNIGPIFVGNGKQYILSSILVGGTMVFLPDDTPKKEMLVKAIEKYSISVIKGIPLIFQNILDHLKSKQLRLGSLKRGMISGFQGNIKLYHDIKTILGMDECINGYGMSEICLGTSTVRDSSIDSFINTVGTVLPHSSAKIINNEGITIPIGEIGQLCFKSYSVFMEYYGDPLKTNESIDVDGWFKTGDYAKIDSDGNITIIGRIVDTLISKCGNLIPPKEVEDLLLTHPKIKDAQVFGIPYQDSPGNQQVVSWIILENDSDSLSLDEITSYLKVLIDPNTPIRVKLLSLSIISKISNNEPQLLHKNLKSFDSKLLSMLLSLLLSTGTNTSLFTGTVPLFVQSIATQDPFLRSVSIPSLVICSRYHSDSMTSSQTKPIETQMTQFLSHASLVSDQRQSSTGFFKIGNTTSSVPVTELDGSITIEFFTVLNNSQVYTEDQTFNIYSFSMLYTWLTSLYKPQQSQQQQSNTSPENRILNQPFQNTIVSYCLRIIDQSKLKPLVESSSSKNSPELDNLSVIALLESVRILDYMCCLDNNLIPKIFPTVQKAYQLHLPSSRTTNANSGHVLLALLQFFVNHSHTLVYDPEPLFRAYFQTYLPRTYMNSFVAFETLNFCLKNKETLLKSSNVFGLYFPPIFKCLAWFPHSYFGEFSELLPSLISPLTYIEVFHLLLDLPLLTSSMESVLVEQKKYSLMGGVDTAGGDINDTAWSEYRVLYNYLLRNESGVNINFWSTTTLPLLQQFCKKTPVTPRVIGSCELVPSLLKIYFDVLLGYADKSIFISLLPVIFERIDQIFPFEFYQKKIKETLVEEILSIFRKYPNLIVSEKELIITVMSEGNRMNYRDGLMLALCWIVGEYSSTHFCPEITPEIFSDYHEALELIAYEKINTIKMDALSGATSSSLTQTPTNINQSQISSSFASAMSVLDSPQNHYNVTIMLVLISSLTKISSRWPDATSRVILCLLKILGYHQYFDQQVIQRANECISLLKFPSFAAAVYNGQPNQSQSPYIQPTTQDSNSSLSFLLMDTLNTKKPSNNPIHSFILK